MRDLPRLDYSSDRSRSPPARAITLLARLPSIVTTICQSPNTTRFQRLIRYCLALPLETVIPEFRFSLTETTLARCTLYPWYSQRCSGLAARPAVRTAARPAWRTKQSRSQWKRYEAAARQAMRLDAESISKENPFSGISTPSKKQAIRCSSTGFILRRSSLLFPSGSRLF